MALGPDLVNEIVGILSLSCKISFDSSCQQQLQKVLGEPAVSLETRDRLSHGSTPTFNKRWLQAFAVGALLFGIAYQWMKDHPTAPEPEHVFPSKFHLASTEVENLLSLTAGTGVAVPTGTGGQNLATLTAIATRTTA
jgi:hypothetical protein